jgi:hypothetical protein
VDTLKEKLESVRRADSRVEATAETRAAKETERRHRDARREENCAL